MMPKWFAVPLVILPLSVLPPMHTSERELERYCWMMWAARAMNRVLRDVHTLDGMCITVVTKTMHQSFVQVSLII